MAKATGRGSGKTRSRRARPIATRAPSTGSTAAKSTTTATVRTIASLRRRLAQARQHIAALEAHADTDFLLDIPNRRGFERELQRSIAYVTRYRTSAALLVVDVDRLKPINDSYGHAAGDHLLKTVVGALSSHIRRSDMLGRLGGDEFGILLWNLDARDARAKAAALERAVDGTICEYRGRRLSTGVSIGVTVLGAGDEAKAVLERADRAMYARKQARRSKRKPAVRR
jgi:diguanylate cyclase (GGDEF)-like protein